MPKAEVGSVKHVANKMKAKGLQRLRWYCQVCQKQCRDENGFKQHTMSESHVRAMVLVGEDPKKHIENYSKQFKTDFLQLLKTSHGEKKVHMNNFYQEYIRDKEHVHMNSTKWPSLTEFAKYLGREGICKVEEGDRGLEIQWIDNSSEAVARREDIKNKEKRAKGDEDLEHMLLQRQIKNAQKAAMEKGQDAKPVEVSEAALTEPVKVKLSLALKPAQEGPVPAAAENQSESGIATQNSTTGDAEQLESESAPTGSLEGDSQDASSATKAPAPAPAPAAAPAGSKPRISLSALSKQKPVNPLMAKNPFAKKRVEAAPPPEKKMSNMERIMKEELERKRKGEQVGYGGKRQKFG